MIEEFLKEENARLSCGSRWLYWDEDTDDWVVLDRQPYAKKNETLYRGTCLVSALIKLKGED